MPFFRAARQIVIVVMMASLAGCYYLQAANGQLDVLKKRQPIEELIADPDTPAELSRRLLLLQDAREFSVEELGLPDNKSYRSFSDVGSDYVVWNVIAAPEFSVEPRTWCFPVAGCVAYRGYFSADRAWKKARKLEARGYDVFVGGATAYSTLGKFNDPVLSTMLRRGDTDLVALLFHELAHQVLYVKDDTSFNESFATAVEELGIERWLTSRGTAEDYDTWRSSRSYYTELTRIALQARDDLEAIYSSDIDDDTRRQQKAARLDRLTEELAERASAAGVDAAEWRQQQPLNNARLASWSAYESKVPAFRRLFESCAESFRCFYAAAAEIGSLPIETRDEALRVAGEQGPAAVSPASVGGAE